jgi:hypothetical protein
VSATTKLELLGLIETAVADGWARACRVLDLADVRAPLADRVAGDRVAG